MKKRLNIKLLAGLVFGATLFLVGVYFLHEFQVRRNADALLARAEAARSQGNLKEAIRIMGRYLAHRPEDVEKYKPLALDSKHMLFDMIRGGKERPNRKMVDRALNLMETAVRENGNDVELRREAADFWFQFSVFDQAVDHLEVVLKSDEATAEDELRYIDCLRRLGPTQEAEAVELLNAMVGYDSERRACSAENASHPELLEAYQTLAILLVNSRFDNDAAEAALNGMVAANADNYKAYLARAELIRSLRREDGAERAREDIERAAALAPDEIEVLVAKANTLRLDEQFDEARALAAQGLAKNPDNFYVGRLYKLLAEIAIREGDIDGAFRVLDEGLAKLPSEPDLLWTKAHLHVDRGEFDKMTAMLDRLRKSRVSPAMIAFLESRVLISEGKFLEASRTLVDIRPMLNTQLQYQVNMFLNQCYAELGQPDAQMETLQRILEVTPDYVPAQISYAENLVRLGRNEEALRRLAAIESKLKEDGEPVPASVDTLKAQLYMRAAEAKPEDERDWGQAERLVNEIWKRTDLEPVRKLILVAQLLMKEGQNDRAIAMIEQGIKSNPDSYVLRALRLDLAKDVTESAEVLKTMEQKFGDTVQVRVARAKQAVKFKPEDAREVIKQQEQNTDKFAASERALLFKELATLNLIQRNRTEAIRLLELASEANPSQLDVLTTLYEIHNTGTDPEALQDVVRRIEKLTTRNNDTWKMAEAGRIVWMVRNEMVDPSNIAQARSLIEAVRQARPEWVPVLLLEADIQQLNNDTDSAIRTLEKAYRLQPSNTNIVRMLAQLYSNIGQVGKAQEMLDSLPYSQRSERDRLARLQMLERQGDFEEAMKLADAVIPATSDTAMMQIWRSRIFLRGGKPDVAEQAARRALELEPERSEVWTNLVQVLASQNKKSEAQAVIQDAELSVAEQVKPIVLGQCHALLGDLNAAKNSYLSALRNDPDNILAKRLLAELLLDSKQLASAMKLLEDILASANAEEHAAEIRWARRGLATILASTGSYTNFKKALELLDSNAGEDGLSGEDLALWVGLSSERPESESWRGAIALLEKIEAERGLTDDEKFMKAQLYAKYDELWPQVSEIVHDLLTRNPENTRIVERWIGWLLQRGDLRRAEMWKKNLPENSITRLRVENHALASAGKHREAAAKLATMVPPDLSTPEALGQLLRVAQMAEELGQYDRRYYQLAEARMRQLVEQQPSQVLLLATMMGLHGDEAKVRESLEMCINAKQRGVSSAYCAAVAITILRKHPDKWEAGLASSIDRLQGWLDTELTASPSDLALKARVAEFHDVLGHLDRVEKEYREILEQAGPMNPQERGLLLNNLAYAMALNGKTEEPLALIEEAIKLLGPTGDLIDTRGFIRLAGGDVDQAVADFQIASNSGAKTGHKLFHLALALDRKGNGRDAADAWKQALEIGLNEYALPPALRGDFRRLQAKYPSTAQTASR